MTERKRRTAGAVILSAYVLGCGAWVADGKPWFHPTIRTPAVVVRVPVREPAHRVSVAHEHHAHRAVKHPPVPYAR